MDLTTRPRYFGDWLMTVDSVEGWRVRNHEMPLTKPLTVNAVLKHVMSPFKMQNAVSTCYKDKKMQYACQLTSIMNMYDIHKLV